LYPQEASTKVARVAILRPSSRYLPTRKTQGAALAIFVAALALSGCQSYRDVKESWFGPSGDPPPCPNVSILRDAAEITQYREGNGRDLTDVLFQGKIDDVVGGCKYTHSGRFYDGVNQSLQLVFNVERGPADRSREAEFSYFIAVSQFFPDPKGRQEFTTRVQFQGNRTKVNVVDQEVRINVPLKQGEIGAQYDIIVGFVLSPEQMQENRQRRPLP
jgi:hypothetical protein